MFLNSISNKVHFPYSIARVKGRLQTAIMICISKGAHTPRRVFRGVTGAPLPREFPESLP
jgi:hypothetical protein